MANAGTRLSDRTYRRLRLAHTLSGVIPVGLYLAFHLSVNAIAVRGPAEYNRAAQWLDQLPMVRVLEVAGIAAPLLFHIGAGVLLGNAGQAFRNHAYPRDWMFVAQRATGGFLAVYVIFHVWATRFSTALAKHPGDLFGLMREQLSHPLAFALYALAVLAAAMHCGLGLIGAARCWRIAPNQAAERRVARTALAVAIVLAIVGIQAATAFVSRAARWLEPTGTSAPAAAAR